MLWLIVGILTIVGIFFLLSKIREGKVSLKVWHWILLILWYAGVLFAIAYVDVSIFEGLPLTAFVAGLFFGIPLLIWAVLMLKFIFLKKPKTQ